MVYYAIGPSYFASSYDVSLMRCMRSCFVDVVSHSSYIDDVDLEYCKFYGDARYKPSRGRDPHRKKSLYVVLKYLSLTLRLKRRARSVRLGLCTDGFAPHGQYDHTYSCWSVIITSYNLSLGMCMSSEYMFLTMVMPGSSDLKRLIDVYLKPLIEELL
ncbi:UNVERIFIED_CONTAM: hypothetical protein Scaly_2764900 [Sesamum calycinum]|uniref:Uncharacterized protein n=1 Tax=Sesamum calycinum TaxID=2727403 RepID=A0AAW2IZ33_9LAMI